MHPYVTEQHEELRAMVRSFVRSEIEPHASRWDREAAFPLGTVLAMGELGLFGISVPEPWGAGGDLTALCIAVEEIAWADQSLAVTLEAGVGLGAAPIARFGTDAQRDRWLPDLCAGKALAAFGLTEPDGGSDARALRTTATLDEDGGAWVIDGRKSFITNSGTPITSLVTVAARTGPEEISTIIVPAHAPGLEVEPAYRKLGWRASDTHGLAFTGCRVAAENLLGERGRGLAQLLTVLDEGRVAIGALAVGVIRRCLDEALAYATARRSFGRAIGSNQAVAFRIADLQVALDSARALVYHAAWLRDRGKPFKREAAVAKLFSSEAAVEATRSAAQVFGGAGFMEESPIARHYRDAKVLEIGEGTSEVQRLVISRELGLPVR